jgi:hypothetical protein
MGVDRFVGLADEDGPEPLAGQHFPSLGFEP